MCECPQYVRLPSHCDSRQASLAAEMFNSGRMGWEPVIEPWTFHVGLTVAHPVESPARSPDASSSGPSCMSASFASDAMLEGTMTLAQFDTAAAAMRVVRQVQPSQRGKVRHLIVNGCLSHCDTVGHPSHNMAVITRSMVVCFNGQVSDRAKENRPY